MSSIRLIALLVVMVLFGGIISAQETVSETCSPAALSGIVDEAYSTFLTRVESITDVTDYLDNLATLRDTISEVVDGCAESTTVDDGSAGTGSYDDPFRFGISGDIGDGLAIKVVGLLRPADTVVRGYNRFNDRAGAGQEYVIVKVEVFCEQGGSSSCATSIYDYKLVGKRGIVYDFASVVNDNDLDVEIFPGATGAGELTFLIDSSDTDLILIQQSRFGGSDGGIFFEAEPSRESGLQITASSNVNIRSSPSTNAGVVGSLQPNVAVLTFGRNQAGTWLQIASGWVFADLVTVDGDIQQLPVTAE